MNSLNLQGISWNFFARDRCVSVSITQSRLIARGHHQRRLILFRVGSIPPKNYLFFFFSFFFFPLRGTRERHPIARRYSFSLSSAGSIRTQASSSSKIGVPLSILKVNEINHPAQRYIYIYIHTVSAALLLLLPLLFPIFSQLLAERAMADIVRLDMFTRDTARGNFWSDISYFLKIVKILHPYPILSLSRDFLILDVSSALKSSAFNPPQSLQDLTPIRSYVHSCSHSCSSTLYFLVIPLRVKQWRNIVFLFLIKVIYQKE